MAHQNWCSAAFIALNTISLQSRGLHYLVQLLIEACIVEPALELKCEVYIERKRVVPSYGSRKRFKAEASRAAADANRAFESLYRAVLLPRRGSGLFFYLLAEVSCVLCQMGIDPITVNRILSFPG